MFVNKINESMNERKEVRLFLWTLVSFLIKLVQINDSKILRRIKRIATHGQIHDFKEYN